MRLAFILDSCTIKFEQLSKKSYMLCTVHLSVRISDFQLDEASSILTQCTKFK